MSSSCPVIALNWLDWKIESRSSDWVGERREGGEEEEGGRRGRRGRGKEWGGRSCFLMLPGEGGEGGRIGGKRGGRGKGENWARGGKSAG